MAALIIDEENNEEQTLDSIRLFDPEERGFFNSEELKTALKRMPGSSQIRDSEMRDILRKADPDDDGKINIQGTGEKRAIEKDKLAMSKGSEIIKIFTKRVCVKILMFPGLENCLIFDKTQVKFFFKKNFISIPFDYLLISRLTNCTCLLYREISRQTLP